MLRLPLQLRFKEPVTAIVEEASMTRELATLTRLDPLKLMLELLALISDKILRIGLPNRVTCTPWKFIVLDTIDPERRESVPDTTVKKEDTVELVLPKERAAP